MVTTPKFGNYRKKAKGTMRFLFYFVFLSLAHAFTRPCSHNGPRQHETSLFGVRRWLQRRLWPGAKPDPNFAEPLPPGSLGCPFFGHNVMKGSKQDGPEIFYRQESERLGHPSIWKLYFLGGPCAAVTGAPLVQDMLSREFVTVGAEEDTSTKKPKNRVAVFGQNNIGYERNQEKHATLRRLVGSGMKGSTLSAAVPLLANSASKCMDQILQGEGPINMHDYSVDYTMDFVQRQLLGCDNHILSNKEDRAKFREALDTWLSALYSFVPFLVRRMPFLVRRLKSYKAKVFLETCIEEKIESLLENGPDTSTLSNMLFAMDEESNAKLTQEQVIENAMFLVAAGAETSSSTLTLTMLLLGLHPDKFQKLVQEQATLLENAGHETLTADQLNSSPYLEAVIKEAMRIGPVSGGFPRKLRETMVIDGVQIPKGWSVFPNIRLTHQLDPVTRLEDDSHMDVRTGFLPERWLDEATTPQDFIPFGAGPRYCLGANLAMLEMKVFLATFARRIASFQLVNGDVPVEWHTATMIPRPADGALIEILHDGEGGAKQSRQVVGNFTVVT